MTDRELIDNLIKKPLKPNSAEWTVRAKSILDKYGVNTASCIMAFNYCVLNDECYNDYEMEKNAIVGLLKMLKQERFEELYPPELSKDKNVFVAMAFNSEMDRRYDEVIVPSITECGYKPIRVDKGRKYEGQIINEIQADICKAHMILADLTEQRGGVYFEAGLARGLQICNSPIKLIISCDKKDEKNIHFDLSGFNSIRYESDEDYKTQLKTWINDLSIDKGVK